MQAKDSECLILNNFFDSNNACSIYQKQKNPENFEFVLICSLNKIHFLKVKSIYCKISRSDLKKQITSVLVHFLEIFVSNKSRVIELRVRVKQIAKTNMF